MFRRRAGEPHGRTETPEARGLALEHAFVARAAAVLFLAAGFLTTLSAELGPASGRTGTVFVALVASAFGIAVWFAPWSRWRASASVWLAPIALIMIAAGSLSGTSQVYDYAVYFAIVHAWLGIAHPRWISLKIAPLTAAAYLGPLLLVAPDPSRAATTGITVIPLCVLLGESIAWLRERLDHSELDRGRLRMALQDGQRVEERLSFLAYHDAVTDLPNRAMFEEHLGIAIANAQRAGGTFSVCAVDLDKFKLINDTLGHAAGDGVLREVAGRLHAVLRAGDVLARVGGDEFLLLLAFPSGGVDDERDPAVHARAATARLMDRMAEELSAPYVIADTEIHLSASLGAAVFPADAADH
ncbi:MAG: hypothetical protein QOI81_1783, partial [Actinomycetota bacterium]|nr:hypothetical protein [Actinomycetota bacterium]